jgi:hypothetical protein
VCGLGMSGSHHEIVYNKYIFMATLGSIWKKITIKKVLKKKKTQENVVYVKLYCL